MGSHEFHDLYILYMNFLQGPMGEGEFLFFSGVERCPTTVITKPFLALSGGEWRKNIC
jgi:hypothetical protein